MCTRRRRRQWVVVTTLVALAVLASAVTFAWVRRTAPPWAAVAGVPYEIPLGLDGCPVIGERPREFVDAPGQLVLPGASDVTLCARPTDLYSPLPEGEQPRQRVLRVGVGEFVALLNGLPDRNAVWRQWQRRHSGWWPDAAPVPLGEACPAIGYLYSYSLVLRYPERQPVSLILTCGTVTSGVRTRMDVTKPHVLDEFLRRYQEQRG